MVVVCWQAWTDIRGDTAVAVNTGCHDVGQRLRYHDSSDCWHFTLRVCLLGTALFWCWQSLLTFGRNLLPHILTPLHVCTVAWCYRRTQDILRAAEFPQGTLQTSEWEWARRVATAWCCTESSSVLSCRRLCRGISLCHRFPHCVPAVRWCHTTCAKVTTTAIK
jgi:hypothetical protein